MWWLLAALIALSATRVPALLRQHTYFDTKKFGRTDRSQAEKLLLVKMSQRDSSVIPHNLASALRVKKNQEQIINAILRFDSKVLSCMGKGDCKLLVAACVSSNNRNMMEELLREFHKSGQLSASLMHIATHLVIKTGDYLWAANLVHLAVEFKLPLDALLLEEIIVYGLLPQSFVEEALDLFHVLVFSHDFPMEKVLRVAAIQALAKSANKVSNTAHLVSIAKLITTKDFLSKSGANKVEVIMMSFLRSCALHGDLASAIAIQGLYTRAFSRALPDSYAIVFNCYQSWLDEEGRHLESSEKAKKHGTWSNLHVQMDAFVAKILLKNIDHSPVVSSELMKYLCAKRDMYSIVYYLFRLQRFQHTLTSLNLVDLSQLINDASDPSSPHEFTVLVATILRRQLHLTGLYPTPAISQYSIFSPPRRDRAQLPSRPITNELLSMEMFFCDLEKWNQGPTVQARYFNILLRGEINRIDFRFLTSDLHSIIVRAIEGRQMSSFMDLTTNLYRFASVARGDCIVNFVISSLSMLPQHLLLSTNKAGDRDSGLSIALLDIYLRSKILCLQHLNHVMQKKAADKVILRDSKRQIRSLLESMARSMLPIDIQSPKLDLYFDMLRRKVLVQSFRATMKMNHTSKTQSLSYGTSNASTSTATDGILIAGTSLKTMPTELDITNNIVSLAYETTQQHPNATRLLDLYQRLKMFRYLWTPVDRSAIISMALFAGVKIRSRDLLQVILQDVWLDWRQSSFAALSKYNEAALNLIFYAAFIVHLTPSQIDALHILQQQLQRGDARTARRTAKASTQSDDASRSVRSASIPSLKENKSSIPATALLCGNDTSSLKPELDPSIALLNELLARDSTDIPSSSTGKLTLSEFQQLLEYMKREHLDLYPFNQDLLEIIQMDLSQRIAAISPQQRCMLDSFFAVYTEMDVAAENTDRQNVIKVQASSSSSAVMGSPSLNSQLLSSSHTLENQAVTLVKSFLPFSMAEVESLLQLTTEHIL